MDNEELQYGVDKHIEEELTILITGLGFDPEPGSLVNTEVIYKELETTHALPYDHAALKAFLDRGNCTMEEIYDIAINEAGFTFLNEHKEEHLAKIEFEKEELEAAKENLDAIARERKEQREKGEPKSIPENSEKEASPETDEPSANQDKEEKYEEPDRDVVVEAGRYASLTLLGMGFKGHKFVKEIHGKASLSSNVKKINHLNNLIEKNILKEASETINPNKLDGLSKKANSAVKQLNKASLKVESKLGKASETVLDKINKYREDSDRILQQLKKSKLAEVSKRLHESIEAAVKAVEALFEGLKSAFGRLSASEPSL